MSQFWKLTNGAIAGTAASVVMFPNDTVRRRLQMQVGRRALPPAVFLVLNVIPSAVRCTCAGRRWCSAAVLERQRRVRQALAPARHLRFLPRPHRQPVRALSVAGLPSACSLPAARLSRAYVCALSLIPCAPCCAESAWCPTRHSSSGRSRYSVAAVDTVFCSALTSVRWLCIAGAQEAIGRADEDVALRMCKAGMFSFGAWVQHTRGQHCCRMLRLLERAKRPHHDDFLAPAAPAPAPAAAPAPAPAARADAEAAARASARCDAFCRSTAASASEIGASLPQPIDLKHSTSDSQRRKGTRNHQKGDSPSVLVFVDRRLQLPLALRKRRRVRMLITTRRRRRWVAALSSMCLKEDKP